MNHLGTILRLSGNSCSSMLLQCCWCLRKRVEGCDVRSAGHSTFAKLLCRCECSLHLLTPAKRNRWEQECSERCIHSTPRLLSPALIHHLPYVEYYGQDRDDQDQIRSKARPQRLCRAAVPRGARLEALRCQSIMCRALLTDKSHMISHTGRWRARQNIR